LNLWLRIKDPALRANLKPTYRVGCKRIIVNSSFYEAIQKPNADLVTEGIQKVVPEGVVTQDGKLHPLDVLVLSTGFHPFNFMRPMDLRGKNGIKIDERWGKKVQAYRSLLIPEFPNFFLTLGQNTPIGKFSVIEMSEGKTEYVLKLIEKWQDAEFDELSATDSALKDFNAYLKEGMTNTVWLGGCQSWYLDADGDPAMWTYTWKQWVKEMEEPNMNDLLTQ